jgi:hypothetical protein
MNTYLRDSLVSGTLASAASMLIAASLGRAAGETAAAPLNAVSHIAFGRRAFLRSRPSVKYTLAGLAINFAGCLFWASAVEQWNVRRPPARAADAVCRGCATAVAAYFVDYHCLPRRYSPGYEKRLSGPGLALVYAVLAFAFPLRGWIERSARTPRTASAGQPGGAISRRSAAKSGSRPPATP